MRIWPIKRRSSWRSVSWCLSPCDSHGSEYTAIPYLCTIFTIRYYFLFVCFISVVFLFSSPVLLRICLCDATPYSHFWHFCRSEYIMWARARLGSIQLSRILSMVCKMQTKKTAWSICYYVLNRITGRRNHLEKLNCFLFSSVIFSPFFWNWRAVVSFVCSFSKCSIALMFF